MKATILNPARLIPRNFVKKYLEIICFTHHAQICCIGRDRQHHRALRPLQIPPFAKPRSKYIPYRVIGLTFNMGKNRTEEV